MEFLNLTSPEGTAWTLFVAVLVIVLAPYLAERVRIPGLIGLLAGGCIIGPNVLGIVSADTGIVEELGEVGLLYLMFLAGLELDLGVFAKYRNRAMGFTVLTFVLPLVLGIIGGFVIGFGFAAALLLGSLFASYTLVAYPIVRNLGLTSNAAIAATVGATVLTDTTALVILAAVAGSTSGDASGVELASQIVLGHGVAGGYCFLVLPRLAKWFFATLGQQRTIRYGFVLAALLSAGVLAEVVGIEGIVGAFFAGLALNRLVPNEGEFMERIDFFGSALLIPMFLVSVGTVIDPAVLVDPSTLGTAAVFVVACVGGKLLAAVLCGPLFHYTRAEIGAVFGLSVAQAAATLAATFVGLQIGLFTTTTVNAVMIVIVVSLILASTCTQRFGAEIPKPVITAGRFGRKVITHVADARDAPVVVAVAARLAAADVGVVQPVVIVPDGSDEPVGPVVDSIEVSIGHLGVDAEVDVRHDTSIIVGILHASSSANGSLLVVSAALQSWLPTLLGSTQHELVATSPVPTALVRAGSEPPTRVVLTLGPTQARRPTSAAEIAVQLADRLRSSGLPLVAVAATELNESLVSLVSHATAVEQSPVEWIEEHALPTDVIVVPGGRNGAMSTARTTKAAALKGCSVVMVADRESVARPIQTVQGLRVVS